MSDLYYDGPEPDIYNVNGIPVKVNTKNNNGIAVIESDDKSLTRSESKVILKMRDILKMFNDGYSVQSVANMYSVDIEVIEEVLRCKTLGFGF